VRIKDSVMADLEDFQAWSANGPAPIDLLDYVGFIAKPDYVFAFAALLMPELVTHEGHRFMASRFSIETYDSWRAKGATPREIQRVMNHLHVQTLVQGQEVSDEVATEVARVIGAIWERTLGPEGLVVEVIGGDYFELAVTFCEKEVGS